LGSLSVIDPERALRLVRDKYVFLKSSHLVEYLHTIAASVAYVDQTIVPDSYTVRDLHKQVARTGCRFGFRTL
jgi:hypothetical protein